MTTTLNSGDSERSTFPMPMLLLYLPENNWKETVSIKNEKYVYRLVMKRTKLRVRGSKQTY